MAQKVKKYYSGSFAMLLALLLESCFFGASTFKDKHNFMLTDSMVIENTARNEKITAITIYTDTVPLFTGRNLILDTIFAQPVDRYQLPFNKDSLNNRYVDIFIKLSRPPQLSVGIVPGDLTKNSKIFFEGDKY